MLINLELNNVQAGSAEIGVIDSHKMIMLSAIEKNYHQIE